MKTQINYLDSLEAENINNLEEKIIKDLKFNLISSSKVGGQSCGIFSGSIECSHLELGFKCTLHVNRSVIQTKYELLEVFKTYLKILLK